jgi:hypothetical protein
MKDEYDARVPAIDDLPIFIASPGAGSIDPENEIIVSMRSTHARPEK